ncbi:Cytochrome P450 94C1 [Camellia lanceoleosa]|uniref:Cytochrome P450 94C1 n=1 Tax=Camellia lanceoleosa TaxID=1840588 RepID=A0ACC0GEA9_9ERIC|nr:Cytochrome P450 94C1 [Camellia lanceoleosa]
MESEASRWLQSLHASFWFLIFSLIIIIISLFTLLLYLQRRQFWCNCKVCQAYITSSWSLQFDNLCDWYTHLLRNSPNKTIHIHVLGNTIISNPDNVEYMLKTRFENYPKGKPFFAILGDLLGKGIFNVDGELWRL